MQDISLKALQTLCERESCWLQQKVESFRDKKVALFPAGPTAQAFYYNLLNNYGIEAELFIDNNPELEGKTICGKPIERCPWEKRPGFNKEYALLIPTMVKYYVQIAEQLENAGISAYMHADAFCACQLRDRYSKVLDMLYDEQSKLAYLGAIYSLLTGDNTFIQYEDNEYFSVKQFVSNEFMIIVDAGAYVGDTVEEYVKHGTIGVKIYAFEPYDKALAKLKARVMRLKSEWFLEDDNIVIVPAGVGAETKSITFSMGNPLMLKPDERGDKALQIYSLDDYFKDKEPFTLLKADIEGGEIDMLKGASKLIQKNKPKMTLCIYHSPEDFAQIAEYVHTLVPEYNLAVRNHYDTYQDTILYCWV